MIRPFAACLLGISLLGAVPVAAQMAAFAPETSPRPLARQSTSPEAVVVRPKSRPASLMSGTDGGTDGGADGGAAADAQADLSSVRPTARPLSEQEISDAARPATLALLSPEISTRPISRPDSIVEQVLFGRRQKRKGAVCGNLAIQGTEIGDIPGKLNGCGVRDAVQVRSVSGVMLSRPSTMSCTTARALNKWVKKGVQPAFRRRGPVVEIRVITDYACRTRNNKPGARISEHGKGKALDISAFTMSDGEVITVLDSWGKGKAGKSLRKVWEAACGPFGTVLGPGADAYHRNHFHVDTASYRSGYYCR